MRKMEAFCEEAVSLLLTAYLFIMFCMFPFYMRNGYLEIGKEKYNFYKAVTAGGFCLIVPLALLCILSHRLGRQKAGRAPVSGTAREGRPEGAEDTEETGKAEHIEGEEGMPEPNAGWYGRLSCTDWAALAYGISVLVSYVGSDYKHTAFGGENGWYMGAAVQLSFVLSYFLVSRFWDFEEKLLLPVFGAAGIVFALGVLNRFSIYPVWFEGANSSFLSTLGNINWYCGYWSVLFPLGFVLYWKEDRPWLRILAFLFTAIGIATGVSQGSSSAFLVFAGAYIFLFCLSFGSMESMKRFFRLAILFCAVCQALRFWRLRQPDAFNYYSGTLSDRITRSGITMAGLAAFAAIYLILLLAERKKHLEIGQFKVIRQITVLLAVILAGVYIFLLVLNSRVEGGIRFMGKLSALTFSQGWGSFRGATWSAAAEAYRNMPGIRKWIGVGPDCFANFLYAIPHLAERVDKQFGGSRLTNAHNEWLNMLVNTGIFGMLSYGAIFISATLRFVHCGEKFLRGKGKCLSIFGFSVFCYAIHNIVSFQQILSTPFVFLALGMGERLLRETASGGTESKEYCRA